MRQRMPAWAVDVALFSGGVAIAAASYVLPESGARDPDLVLVVVMAIQLVTLLTWRRFPAASVAMVVAAWSVETARGYALSDVPFVPVVVLFLVAARASSPRSAPVAGAGTVAVVAVLVGAWAATDRVDVSAVGVGVSIAVFAFFFGRWWRRPDASPSEQAIGVGGRVWEQIRSRPFVVDVLMFVGVSILAWISHLAVDAEEFRRPDGLLVFLQLIQLSTLLTRRAYPVSSLGVAAVGWIVERLLVYAPGGASLVVPILLYHVGAHLPRVQAERAGWSGAAFVSGLTGVGWAVDPTVSLADFLSTVAITVIPFLLGRRSHDRATRLELAELRAEQAEREREERAVQAVADERARIARELHDVVAHQMAVMTLQAEGASRLVGDADPRVREALQTIRTAGHESLAEMRRMVGLLRTDDSAGLAPQPGLAQLDELAQGMREAGLAIELTVEGADRPVADGIGLGVYRIVQESLTNALKHGGPGVSARVAVRHDGSGIDVEVVDDGRGAAAAADPGGHGLVGMRERVALVGGTFDAGPAAGGGYRLRARLPVESS